ncbi:MAG: amidohydrolase family protein [Proteobacteria bacterium]|nr:amidohydrolase family protein [Pseudomonadota bacterium]
MSQILLHDCALLDVERGEVRPGHFVLVEDDLIREVSDREITAPEARRIDVRGRTLMPGLIDAHVHAVITTMNLAAMLSKPVTLVAQEARVLLEAMLRRGFTTVRDAGGADWGLAQAVERGLVQGPRIFFAGRTLSQTGGHGDFRPRDDAPNLCACTIYSSGFSHVADGVDAVRKAAREELRRGANQIKIMASGGVASPTDPIWNLQYSEEEMRAIVEEARSWRTYAMAHAYTPEAITRALRAGVRTIEHANLIDAETAALAAEKGAYVVPTLVTYYAIDELGRALGFPETSQRKVKDVLAAGLASLEICRDAGVPMGFGTDLLGETHEQQSREFRIRAEVLSPAEILRSATLVNAEILGKSGELGVVAPGARADLLVVDGNPLDDLSLLGDQGKHLDLIMKGGELVTNRA